MLKSSSGLLAPFSSSLPAPPAPASESESLFRARGFLLPPGAFSLPFFKALALAFALAAFHAALRFAALFEPSGLLLSLSSSSLLLLGVAAFFLRGVGFFFFLAGAASESDSLTR